MARRLLHANLTNDKAALDEVLKLLSEIHEAWVAIGDKVNNGTAN
jgi:flagellar protein FliS